MQRQRRPHTHTEAMLGRHEQPTVRENILKFEGTVWRPPAQKTQTKHGRRVRKAFPFKTSLVQQQIRKFEGQTEEQKKSVRAGERSVEDPCTQSLTPKKPKKMTKPHYSRPKVCVDDVATTGAKEKVCVNEVANTHARRKEFHCATVRKHILMFEELARPRTARSGEFVYETEEIKDQPIALIRERFLGNEKLKYQPSFCSDENLQRWKQYASEHEARVREHIRKFEKLNIQHLLASEQATNPRIHTVSRVPHKINKRETQKANKETLTANAAKRNVRRQKKETVQDTLTVIPTDAASGKGQPPPEKGSRSVTDRMELEKGRLKPELDRSRSEIVRSKQRNDCSDASLHLLPKADTSDLTMEAMGNAGTHNRKRSTMITMKNLEKDGNGRKLHIPKININIRKFEKLAILQVGDKAERKPKEEIKHRSVVEKQIMKFEILNLNLD